MIFLFRFSGLFAGCLVGILAWCFLPGQISGRNAVFLSDFLKTYVTIATILIGFSAGITNSFITGTNEKMMRLIRKHHFYRSFLWQFHATTTINFVGLVLGLFTILLLEYIPGGRAAWWTVFFTLSVASAGVAMFLSAAWTSTLIAQKTEELLEDE